MMLLVCADDEWTVRGNTPTTGGKSKPWGSTNPMELNPSMPTLISSRRLSQQPQHSNASLKG